MEEADDHDRRATRNSILLQDRLLAVLSRKKREGGKGKESNSGSALKGENSAEAKNGKNAICFHSIIAPDAVKTQLQKLMEQREISEWGEEARQDKRLSWRIRGGWDTKGRRNTSERNPES